MNKLSSEDFQFQINERGNGSFEIELQQISTDKVKTFSLARGKLEKLRSHMNSLTDSQCEQWFTAGERKKPKKQ